MLSLGQSEIQNCKIYSSANQSHLISFEPVALQSGQDLICFSIDVTLYSHTQTSRPILSHVHMPMCRHGGLQTSHFTTSAVTMTTMTACCHDSASAATLTVAACNGQVIQTLAAFLQLMWGICHNKRLHLLRHNIQLQDASRSAG